MTIVATLKKLIKTITTEQPPILVLVPAETIVKADTDAKLTTAGYEAVKAKLNTYGYGWTLTTHFDYYLINTEWNNGSSTAFDAYGNEIKVITGWNVIFVSTFQNGLVPPAMWIPDNYSDTPLGGGTVTIPEHYENSYPADVVTFSQNLGWNSGTVSSLAIKGDGYVTFRFDIANTGTVAGIADGSGAYSQGYDSITHGIKTAGNQYHVVESGVNKTVASSFVNTDVFKVAIASGIVTYYKNATLIYTSLTVHNGEWWLFDCSFYEADDAIYDADFMSGYLGGFDSIKSSVGVYDTVVDLKAVHTTIGEYDSAIVGGVVYIDTPTGWVSENDISEADAVAAIESALPSTGSGKIVVVGGVVYIDDATGWINSGTEGTTNSDLLRIVEMTPFMLTITNEFTTAFALHIPANYTHLFALTVPRTATIESLFMLSIPRPAVETTEFLLSIPRDTFTKTNKQFALIVPRVTSLQSIVIDVHSPENPIYGEY